MGGNLQISDLRKSLGAAYHLSPAFLEFQTGSCHHIGHSVTSLTFLRPAISSAMATFSASDNIRAAKGNTRLSSTLMCCLYIDARLATALRKSSTSALERLPVERYCVPRPSTSACKGLPSDAPPPGAPALRRQPRFQDGGSDATEEIATPPRHQVIAQPRVIRCLGLPPLREISTC